MKRIDYNTAIDFLLPRHYSGRKPNVKYAFGHYEGDKLVAVCTFGKPASHSLCIGVCGEEFSSSVYELNRLCVDGDMSVPLSQFLAQCLRELKSENLVIVSYADTMMNHHGYIYQATNFIYTGATKARTDKYVAGNKHSRHYSNDEQNGLRKYRSAKHRYVYFTGDRKFVKNARRNLRYPVQDYPKGDNENYELGDFAEPILVPAK